PLWALGWSDALAAVALGFDRLVRKRVNDRELLERKRALEAAVAERTQSLLAANEELAAVRDAYIKLAEVDALTQIGNRRYFEKELNRAMALTSRLAMPLCLMIADIDYFKAVNDRLGHPVGDEYLRKIGRVLADTARLGEDIVARLGGEEFAILLINTRQEGGQVFAERVRGAVAALELANSGGVNGRVSLSIGVTVRDPSEQIDAAQLIERADIALYQAKREGRDRIVVL
ncbi:MAG TPA: GGDEF domain-containing protein, partial [Usitatibacteraceae bacterium]|nr:GGDEF domain-containing protein [Usitatibacteraceae bacterium]